MNFMDMLLDGVTVEWKPLRELGELVRGNGLQKKDFTETGVPAIHYGQIYTYYGLSTTETKSFVSPEMAQKLRKVNKGDVVITNTSENFEDVGKALVYLGERQAVTGGHATIFKPGSCILGKYLAYYTQTNEFADEKRRYAKGAKVIDISATDMGKILIPTPCPENPKRSLEIQTEILRILDSFTALTAELTTKLKSEHTARTKQYSYYRDQLLSFEEDQVAWSTLGEIAELRRGRVMSKEYLTENAGQYPVYSSQTAKNGQIGKISTFDFDGEFINWTTDGANAGTVFYRSGKFSITNVSGLIKIIDRTTLDCRFLFHWLSVEAKKHVYSGMGNPKLMSHQVAKIPVPLPTLAEQERIASLLDKFDILTTSISEGLPHEIKLRQKQYEYYRKILLSFPRPKEVAV